MNSQMSSQLNAPTDASMPAPTAASRTALQAIVVKLGGRTQADPSLPAAIAALFAQWPGRVVVVHGGGDQISVLQQQRGDTPRFVGGRRVTTESDLDVVRMALSGLANKQLVSAFVALKLPAVGVSGEDAGFLRAAPIDQATFGFAGTPVSVDVRLVALLLKEGYLPVLSPVAAHEDRSRAQAMNVNGDDAAAAIASALGAEELFFMADVPAVKDADNVAIASVSPKQAAALIESGVAAGGMAAKLEAGMRAIAQGVGRVRIGDLAALTTPEAGTAVVAA